MKRVGLRILVWMLLLGLPSTGAVLAGPPGPGGNRVANLNVSLEPGVLHAWVLGPSDACGGYIVEVTPKRPAVDGAYVQTAEVRPEFDGTGWHDVLRAGIPAEHPPLKANLRVYQTCSLDVAFDLDATLVGGEWMGWVVGPASADRGYVVEVTPLHASVAGAYVERALVQQEYFMGEWQDIVRVQLASGVPDLVAQIRVFSTRGMPVLAVYDIDLAPGVWTGTLLRPATGLGGYVIEINPRGIPSAGEYVERSTVQPEFNGQRWNDVLRLMSPADQPPLSVQARVYGWGTPPGGP